MYSSSTCIFNVESHILLVTVFRQPSMKNGVDVMMPHGYIVTVTTGKKDEKATANSGTERPEDTVMIGDVATAPRGTLF